jgi:hypothetical protein
MKTSDRTQKNLGGHAQAMVEFALVLPILIALLVGLLEVGRLIFTYAAVNNASREAVRYASAIGLNDGGTQLKYLDCVGIRNMARRSAFFLNLQDTDILIRYDQGPGTGSFASCDGNTVIDFGTDRVEVEVRATYRPLTKLIPLGNHNFKSKSSRTIIGFVDLAPCTGGGAAAQTSTAAALTITAAAVTSGPTATGTLLATDTPTATSSPTTTATAPILLATFTPLPSSTPTLIPSGTPTATATETATPTATGTGTSTPSSSCDTISASEIRLIDGTNFISMSITNPYIDVTVSSITLAWNDNGAQGSPETLTLDSANLGTTFWSGLNNSSGTITLTPPPIFSQQILPGNNAESTITFRFLQNYDALKMSGTTITVVFSTPGCSEISKTAK